MLRFCGLLGGLFSGFLEHAYKLKQQTTLETRVPLLELLSKPLRGELHCARYEHQLRRCRVN